MAIRYSGNDHYIEYNEIYNVVLHSSDAGAIYSGFEVCDQGNVLRYNCIYNIGSGEFKPQGIYFDDGMAGQTAYGNILVNIPHCGFLIGGGRDNKVYRNLIINAGVPISFDGRLYEGFHSQGWFKPHVLTKDGRYWEKVKKAKEMNAKWGNKYPNISEIHDDFDHPEDKGFAVNPTGSEVTDNIIGTNFDSIGYIAPSSAAYAKCRFSSCSDPLFLKFTFKLDPGLVTSKSRYLYLKLTHPKFTPRIDPLPYNVFTSYPCSLR